MSCSSMASSVIVQGEDKTLNIYLKNSDGSAYDLSGATITVKFPKTATTSVDISGTIVTAAAGHLSVTISDTNSALMQIGDNQSIEVQLVVGSVTTIVQIDNAVSIKKRLYT